MELWEQAYKDYISGMKYQSIADKYDVTINTVKSWKTRHWNNKKCAHKNKKSMHTKSKKVCTQKQGAPKGNHNAVGHGAPINNRNSEKHGGYAAVKRDTFDDDERYIAQEMPRDEEQLLINLIIDYDVRERRLMKAINKYRELEDKGGLYVDGVDTAYIKREFENESDRDLYKKMRQKKINDGSIGYLGYDKSSSTSTAATILVIQRLEKELTGIQRAKMQSIKALEALRKSRREDEERQARVNKPGLLGEFMKVIEEAGNEQS